MSIPEQVKLLTKRIDELEKELTRLKYLVDDIQTKVKPVQLPRLLMRVNAQ
jgi:ribosomal protein S15P/S13E